MSTSSHAKTSHPASQHNARPSAAAVIVELRAAEGGDDAKALVEEQFDIYARRAARSGL